MDWPTLLRSWGIDPVKLEQLGANDPDLFIRCKKCSMEFTEEEFFKRHRCVIPKTFEALDYKKILGESFEDKRLGGNKPESSSDSD